MSCTTMSTSVRSRRRVRSILISPLILAFTVLAFDLAFDPAFALAFDFAFATRRALAGGNFHFRSRILFSCVVHGFVLGDLKIRVKVFVACRMAGSGRSFINASGPYSWACKSQNSQQSNIVAVRSSDSFILYLASSGV